MADQLSGVAVIICIALGCLTFVLLFIFGKRQIMRFSLKSGNDPHAPVAYDAPKSLRQEIDRRLDVVSDIQFEPKVMNPEQDGLINEMLQGNAGILNNSLYRMKAVDSLHLLDQEISNKDVNKRRQYGQDLRVFLLKLAHGGLLTGFDARLIHEFADLYDHARHEPLDFTCDHLNRYLELLNFLCHWIADGRRTHTAG